MAVVNVLSDQGVGLNSEVLVNLLEKLYSIRNILKKENSLQMFSSSSKSTW